MIQSVMWCVLILALGVAAGPSVARAEDPKGQRVWEQLWERHWRVYAQRCAEFEDGYLCAPKYDRRYPSSTGITVRQAEAELSEKVRVGGAGIVMTKTVRPPEAEAQAIALPIPKMKIGEYGFLASAEVLEVLGPTSMVVEDIYLLDPAVYKRDYRADRAKARQAEDTDDAEAALKYIYTHRDALVERQKDKRHKKIVLRVEGYPTAGLAEGDRWAGPKDQGFAVLIAKAEHYGSERRPKVRAVAVAVDQITWGLEESAFIAMLEARELTKESFIGLVMERMSAESPEVAQQQVFASLLPPSAPPDKAEQDDPALVAEAPAEADQSEGD